MKSVLKKTMETLVQGMAYWIAYSCEINTVKFTEAEAVGEIIKILQSKITFPAKICREVEYKSVCPSVKSNQRADIGIYFEDKCQCLIEVKLSENTNGGYKSDIKKLTQIKQDDDTIDCFVILLYRNFCGIDDPKSFVSVDGKALKRTIVDDGCKIRVRRVSNAISSMKSKKMKKVVCFEVL